MALHVQATGLPAQLVAPHRHHRRRRRSRRKCGSVAQIDDFVSDSNGLKLTGAFMRIDTAAVRRRIVMLVQEIAGDDD